MKFAHQDFGSDHGAFEVAAQPVTVLKLGPNLVVCRSDGNGEAGVEPFWPVVKVQ